MAPRLPVPRRKLCHRRILAMSTRLFIKFQMKTLKTNLKKENPIVNVMIVTEGY